MNVIARIINGFCSVIGVFLGLLGFLLSGVMASFVPEVAAFTALTTLLPFIIILLSVIGLYGVIKNNIKYKLHLIFACCLHGISERLLEGYAC